MSVVKVDAEGPVPAAAVGGGGAGRAGAALPRGVRPGPASPAAGAGAVPCLAGRRGSPRAAEGRGHRASPGGDFGPANPCKGAVSGAAAGRCGAVRLPGELPALLRSFSSLARPLLSAALTCPGRLMLGTGRETPALPQRCGVSVA